MVPSQAEGPRELKVLTWEKSISDDDPVPTEPTAKALLLLAGEMLLSGPAGPGSMLPPAKTTAIPASLRACTSGWNSVLHCPARDSKPQELLTMSGASSVAGFPSGSSSQAKAWWMRLSGALSLLSKIFAAIQRAPGATPMAVPVALPPTSTPATAVPWATPWVSR